MPRSKQQQVEDAQKQAQVLELRKGGLTFQQIADELGYADHTGAKWAYDAAMAKTIGQPATELRQLELLRLDQLWAKWYPLALQGKKYALDGCIDIIRERAKLTGSYAPTKHQVTITDELTQQIEDLARELGVQDPDRLPEFPATPAPGEQGDPAEVEA